ncbi:MAG: hypothetical protein AAGF12_38260 [Myxococcota bacterium]
MESVIPSDRVDVLVFGSSGLDLRGMRNQLGERVDGYIRGIHVTGKTVGLGMPAAGPSAAKRVFQLDPKAVIQLGTCGAYPGTDLALGSVVVAQNLHLLDPAVLTSRGAFPDPMHTTLPASELLSTGLAQSGDRVRRVAVGCPLTNTTDDRLAEGARQKYRLDVENLEAFAIAHACSLASVPFACVHGVSHRAGSESRTEWQRHERTASLAAADVVISWLQNGAQGMPHG